MYIYIYIHMYTHMSKNNDNKKKVDEADAAGGEADGAQSNYPSKAL